MRSKIARRICWMVPLVVLPPALIVSCAQNSEFDITIDRTNNDHLSSTNSSVTLTAKIFDKKSQMDVSDQQCCEWTCHSKLPSYIKQITNGNVITLVLSTNVKVSSSQFTFTASCGNSSKSVEVTVDDYSPPNYDNEIHLTKDNVFLTQTTSTSTIDASITGRDSGGTVTFDCSKLPPYIESNVLDNQLTLSLKSGSDTERDNFTINVSFNDAAIKTIVVETENYESWPADCIPKDYLDITGSTFNRIKQGITPTQLDSFTTLKIPKQVTRIANWALGYDATGGGTFVSYLSSNNTILDWGESKITSIGYYSFIMAPFTGKLVLPSTLTTLTEGCFGSCDKFTSLDMSYATKLTSIPKTAFMGCTALQSIKFYDGIKTIGPSAFSDCESLVGDLTFPTELTFIGASAFAMAGLRNNAPGSGIELKWNPKIVTIDQNAFGNAKIIGDLIIPDSAQTIGQTCFNSTLITSVTIGRNVKTIGYIAFEKCRNLTSFTILSQSYFSYRATPTSQMYILGYTPIDPDPNNNVNSTTGAQIIVPSNMYQTYTQGDKAWPARLNIVSA